MTSAGVHDLAVLLSSLDPDLDDTQYVFVVVAAGDPEPALPAIVTIVEDEGTTLVLDAPTHARAVEEGVELVASAPMARITLRVHSSLEAVGLTAAVAGQLAGADISCNVVAGWFHDQLFVPADHADRAVELLRALSGS